MPEAGDRGEGIERVVVNGSSESRGHVERFFENTGHLKAISEPTNGTPCVLPQGVSILRSEPMRNYLLVFEWFAFAFVAVFAGFALVFDIAFETAFEAALAALATWLAAV